MQSRTLPPRVPRVPRVPPDPSPAAAPVATQNGSNPGMSLCGNPGQISMWNPKVNQFPVVSGSRTSTQRCYPQRACVWSGQDWSGMTLCELELDFSGRCFQTQGKVWLGYGPRRSGPGNMALEICSGQTGESETSALTISHIFELSIVQFPRGYTLA